MQETLFQKLKRSLPRAEFQPPTTADQIAAAEEKLGIKMPEWLREIYLNCNGFSVPGYDYLISIETPKDLEPVPPEIEFIRGKYTNGLIGTNLFLRSIWDESLDLLLQNRPETDWKQQDVHNLLIISAIDTQDWAIDRNGGSRIFLYDTRADDLRVVAEDLLAACVQHEASIARWVAGAQTRSAAGLVE